MGRCEESQSSRGVMTVLASGIGAAKMETGEEIFTAVCSGCHAFSFRLIGPAVREIQETYAGNSEGIVAFALAPTKIRKDFPPMPSQSHLGKDRLSIVARYILDMTK
jgi:cytochrome c551/c552